MRHWWVGVAAAVAVVAMAAPAGAAPTNAKSATVFPGSICTSEGGVVVTDFIVNGNGKWTPAHSDVGVWKPVSLVVTGTDAVTGEQLFQDVLVKNNAEAKGEWLCSGEALQEGPNGPVVITFVALAHR